MHASSNDQSVRSGGAPSAVVTPGAQYLKDFLLSFAEMPHRGSATPNEPRAARLLTRRLEAETSTDVELQPFAVDISSGAWGIAVHGVLLVLGTLAAWIAGLLSAWSWGDGPWPAQLGYFGTVPFPFAAAALAWCIVMVGSRLYEDRTGFHIASFFVPNADSANVIASSLPRLEQTGTTLRMSDRDQWTKRFREAKDAGTRRIVVLMGHYDSARWLPFEKPPKFLLAALKSGMGRLLTRMYLLLAVVLAIVCVLGALGLNGIVYSGWIGIVVSIILMLSAATALAFAAAEGGMAACSASRPFVQGMNDNFSAVAALFGAMVRALPKGKARTLGSGTQVVAAFTGSEENGLRGASLFSKDVLTPAVEIFGPENVVLVNMDSVSGGKLYVQPREVNFSGREVGGRLAFAEEFHAWARGPHILAADADLMLTARQKSECLVQARSGAFGLRLEYDREALPACTDMTGVWAGLPRALRRQLRGFSIVSRVADGDDPIGRPRDYHLPSDNVDTLLLDEEPANFGTVAALALTLEAYLH